MKTISVVILLVLAAMAYVRLSPNDPTRWHQPIRGDQDKRFENGAIRVLSGTAEDFARLNEVAVSWSRTRVLAGSVAEGRVTYVTRTAVWGFPDFTTVERREGQIAIYARSRFGRSDLGVNGKRIDAWLGALAQR